LYLFKMEEEAKKEQPSLKDQAKELWAKIARML
jgi:hypothetical protein